MTGTDNTPPKEPAPSGPVIWVVSQSPGAREYGALARSALGGRVVRGRRAPEDCALVIVGPEEPSVRLPVGVPIIGIGSGGLAALGKLDNSFRPAKLRADRANVADADPQAISDMFPGGPPPGLDRSTIVLGTGAMAIPLADVATLGSSEQAPVVSTNDPSGAVLGTDGRLGFWGPTQPSLLSPAARKLFAALVSKVTGR